MSVSLYATRAHFPPIRFVHPIRESCCDGSGNDWAQHSPGRCLASLNPLSRDHSPSMPRFRSLAPGAGFEPARPHPEEPQALKACPLVHSGTPALHKDQRPTDIPQAVHRTAHRKAPSAITLKTFGLKMRSMGSFSSTLIGTIIVLSMAFLGVIYPVLTATTVTETVAAPYLSFSRGERSVVHEPLFIRAFLAEKEASCRRGPRGL